MYDLRIGNKERPEVAIECVGAVDEQHAALWGFVEKKGPPSGEFHGDWIVEVTPSASLDNIYRELGIVLFDLEQSRVFSATRDCWLERSNTYLWEKLESLQINYLQCSRSEGSGRVSILPPPKGGAVDSEGKSLGSWLHDFLISNERADVLYKLTLADAPVREVLIDVFYGGVPWPVYSYLTGDLDLVPVGQPILPEPLTGVWVVLAPGKGIRWDGQCWRILN